MSFDHCTGEHEIYVAEVVGLEAQGKIVVVTVCRRCERVNFHEHTVGSDIRLLKEEKDK